MEKRKGKAKVVFDVVDIQILNLIGNAKKPLTVTELKEGIGLTHPNLLTHFKRLNDFIKREREQQRIYLSLTRAGEEVIKLFEKK